MHLTEQMAELVISMQAVQGSMQRGDARLGSVEIELKANSATTAEVRDILQTGKAGLKVLAGLGSLLRWAGYLATAGAALYVGWHMITHGGKPPGD